MATQRWLQEHMAIQKFTFFVCHTARPQSSSFKVFSTTSVTSSVNAALMYNKLYGRLSISM